MNQILRHILTEPWAIYPGVLQSYLPGLGNLFSGKPFGKGLNGQYVEPNSYHDDNDGPPPRNEFNPYITASNGELVDRFDFRREERGVKNAIPPGSIFLLEIRGEILKYDEDCGPRGTKTHHAWLNKAYSHQNIDKIILVVDGPGGMATYTDLFASAIHNGPKPVYTFVEGMAASATYWVGSAGKEIYASSANDEVGSIGTMVFFGDLKPMFEKKGVKFHEFYASLSTDKNGLFNKVLNGDYDEYIKTKLDPLNNSFIQAVKSHRVGVDDSVFTGKMYRAQEAKRLGLIDDIASFSELYHYVQNSTSNSKMGLFSKEKTPKSKEAFDAAKNGGEPTGDQLTEANKELASQKSGIRLMSASDLEQAMEAVETLSQTQQERDDALEAKETAEQELADFKSGNPGTRHTATNGDGGEGAKQSYGWTSYLTGTK